MGVELPRGASALPLQFPAFMRDKNLQVPYQHSPFAPGIPPPGDVNSSNTGAKAFSDGG